MCGPFVHFRVTSISTPTNQLQKRPITCRDRVFKSTKFPVTSFLILKHDHSTHVFGMLYNSLFIKEEKQRNLFNIMGLLGKKLFHRHVLKVYFHFPRYLRQNKERMVY